MVHKANFVILLLLAGLLCIQADPSDKVKAAKEKLARALADDEAGWAEYVQEIGRGNVMNLLAGPLTKELPEQARAEVFKPCFKAQLREADRLNKAAEAEGYEGVAFGINTHTHLCPDDFAALRTTGLLHGPAPEAHAQTAEPRKKGRRVGPVGGVVRPARKPTPPNPPPPIGCTSSTGSVTYSTTSYPTSFMSTTIPEVSATQWSWVDKGINAVRDQGNCGSCVAFSTTAVTEWALYQREKNVSNAEKEYAGPINYDLSEDDLMECEPYDGCSGSYLETYFAAASCRGQGLERDFPYNFEDSGNCPINPTREAIKQKMNLKWAKVSPRTSDELQRAVTYAPAQIGILVDSTFRNYAGGVLRCGMGNSGSFTNHGVVVVGYGIGTDKIPYFLIRNSWGADWPAPPDGTGYLMVERGCPITKKSYGPCQILLDPPIVPVLN